MAAEPVLDLDALDHKQRQTAYHDFEARTYEAKFGISYDQHVIDYARGRFVKVVPSGRAVGNILELGAGTGFFTVSLALAGCIAGELHCSDLSPGMLEVCRRNGADHGLDLRTHVADAEDLPFDDDTFDLVLGHAFIHHLPVPGRAFQEAWRVLRPGGRLVIAGEPTYWGDRVSTVVKRTVYRGFTAVTRIPGLGRLQRPDLGAGDGGEAAVLAALEHQVDLHTFRPDEVERMAAIAGFEQIRLVTEELTSNWWGWGIRTIEGSIAPGILGMRWATTAFAGYRALGRLDERALQRVVPRGLFYNLIVTGRKPVRG